MVEDLMNVTLDWDTSTSLGEEIWAPRGRLVAHINEHTQAINQLSINSNNRQKIILCHGSIPLSVYYSMLVTSSDDCSIRIWNTEQFFNHSKPSNFYKSRNNWHSQNNQKVKRASFTENTKVAVSTNTALYFLDIECLKSASGSIWMRNFDSKNDGIITGIYRHTHMLPL